MVKDGYFIWLLFSAFRAFHWTVLFLLSQSPDGVAVDDIGIQRGRRNDNSDGDGANDLSFYIKKMKRRRGEREVLSFLSEQGINDLKIRVVCETGVGVHAAVFLGSLPFWFFSLLTANIVVLMLKYQYYPSLSLHSHQIPIFCCRF